MVCDSSRASLIVRGCQVHLAPRGVLAAQCSAPPPILGAAAAACFAVRAWSLDAGCREWKKGVAECQGRGSSRQ
jgi:hypothetical protein